MREHVNVINEVLSFLTAVLEGVGQRRSQMLKNLSPLDVDLRVVRDSYFTLGERFINTFHLFDEHQAVQITKELDHIVFCVDWSNII